MVWQDVSFWEIVLDTIALCLCGTAVIALIRERRRLPVPAAVREPKEFGDVLKRVGLEGLTASGGRHPLFQAGGGTDVRSDGPPNDRYHEVEDLADSGFSAEEITERTRVPKGEIALVMKLRQQASEFRAESREKRAAVS